MAARGQPRDHRRPARPRRVRQARRHAHLLDGARSPTRSAALLDHLELERAVVGGTSLGANVTLELAVHHPESAGGLFIEMPVLEDALLGAAMVFTPILLALRFGEPVLRAASQAPRRVPRTQLPRWTSASTGCAGTPIPRGRCWRGCCSGARRRHREERSGSSTRRWSSAIPPTRCTRSPTPACWSRRCPTPASSTPTRSSSGGSPPPGSTTSWRSSSTRSSRAPAAPRGSARARRAVATPVGPSPVRYPGAPDGHP